MILCMISTTLCIYFSRQAWHKTKEQLHSSASTTKLPVDVKWKTLKKQQHCDQQRCNPMTNIWKTTQFNHFKISVLFTFHWWSYFHLRELSQLTFSSHKNEVTTVTTSTIFINEFIPISENSTCFCSRNKFIVKWEQAEF